MEPTYVVWIGILIALTQVAVTKILNFYFPDGYTRKGIVKKDDVEKNEEE